MGRLPEWHQEEINRRRNPVDVPGTLEKLARGVSGDMAALRRNSRRFDWRRHPENKLEAVLWRGNESVGAFEWSDGRRLGGVAKVFETELTCSRGRLNLTRIAIRSAGFGSHRLDSVFRRPRSRVLRWAGRPAYRWLFDPYSRWHWVTDLGTGGLVSFAPPNGGIRELDGLETWVSREILDQPETPYLIVVGWFLLMSPFGGFPLVPSFLRRLP